MANYSDPIRIWAYGDYVQAAHEAVKIYKRDVDPDVNVQITAIAYSEFDDMLNGALQSGDPPDIVLLTDEKIKSYLGEFLSSFVPLKDYIDQSGIPFNFIPYKMEKVTYDNQIYGVPFSSVPAVLYYREDILNEEELSADDLSTWDGLRQFGERLREKGKYLLPPLQCLDMEICLDSVGRCYLDESGNSDVVGIKETMGYLKEFYDDEFIYPSNLGEEDVQGLLYSAIMEGVPAFIGGCWWYSTLKAITGRWGNDWRVAPLPKSGPFNNDVGLNGYSWMVTNTGNQDKAVDFVLKTFATSTELAVSMAENYNIVPAYEEAIEALRSSGNYFEDKDIIQVAADLGREIPESQQKIFRRELVSCFKHWLNEVVYNEFPINEIKSKFEDICNCLRDLDPTKYYEMLLSDIHLLLGGLVKNSYVEGETFDSTGLKVSAEYFNLPSQIITQYTYSPTGPLSAGLQAITISYSVGDITKSNLLWLEVAAKSLAGIKIEQMPDKLTYEERRYFDKTGMKVRVFYNNDTSELVEDYTYSPTGQLSMQSPKITVSYTRDAYLATVTFPITVTDGGPLKGITVVTPPNQTVYKEGDGFDKTGMVVRADYEDNTNWNVSNYTVTPKKLSVLDKKVIVSYTEKGITKTTEVGVTVLEDLADGSKKNQTELKYGCGAGAASVNLFKQRLLFEHPDLSMGANTYQIAVSHVYNSLFDERTTLGDAKTYIRTGMGKGFKLNVQQYVLPNLSNYLYIDGAGRLHAFQAGERGIRYYDTDGLGLILTFEGTEKIISDDFGNKMVFDEAGRLVRTISGDNAKMIKVFNYNDKGQLTEIYDDRNKNNVIALEYDQTTGLLKTMSCREGEEVKHSLTYVYQEVGVDFMLVDILDERGNSHFAYDAESRKMTYVASKLDKSALKFTYSNGALTEVSTGVIDNETSVGGTAQISSAALCMSAENVQSKNTFAFNKASAVVTNEKGIQLLYSFNPDGVTTSILEANGGDINDLRTLEKQPGVRMMSEGSSSERINNQKVYWVMSNEVLSTDNVITLSEVISYRKKKCPDYKYYICSFWLKFSKATSENCEAKIKVVSYPDSEDSVTEEGRVTIDNTAVNSWQLVAIPVRISGNNIENIEIELSGVQTYKIGDMRLYYSPLVRFCVGNREGENVPLDEITQIKILYLGASTYMVRDIDRNCYMTEKDLQATYLSRYNGQGYTLSLCDNTQRYKVSEVKLCGQGKEFTLELDTKGRAQFYQETQSPDGGVHIYGEVYFNKDADGTAFSGICQYTEAVKGGTKSCTSTYVDYKGKIRRERDEYKTETVYEYDADGVFSVKKLFSTQKLQKSLFMKSRRRPKKRRKPVPSVKRKPAMTFSEMLRR